MKTPALPCRARPRAFLFTLIAALLLALTLAPARISAASCGDTYTVRPGDTLTSISVSCDVSIATIARLNQLGAYLHPGQVLQIADPYAPRFYVVQPGDTLSGIALRLGLAPTTLAAENGLADPNAVRAGQVLRWRLADVQSTPATNPAPAAVPATSSGHGCDYLTYTVRPGDTLSTIALAYHAEVAALAVANGIADPSVVPAGATLRIPLATAASPAVPPAQPPTATTSVMMRSHVVQPGDTLWGIARALGLTPQALAQDYGLDLAAPIRPGQVLRYPVVVYSGPTPAEVGAVLDQQAAQVGVESALLKAVAWRESSWRMVDAPDGGMGVMQLMPTTVRWLKLFYLPGSWDPHDLVANVYAGAVLLQLYSRIYGGDVAKIAAAYHGGMGALLRRDTTAEMARYVRAVIAYRQAFLDGSFPA